MPITNKYEQLDALLDTIMPNPEAWLSRLQSIRKQADYALDMGAMADHQWRALVKRSARIQDNLNRRAEA